MKINFLHIADYANVTGDGKLNIMGIFNVIFTREFPTRNPTMYLVVRLEAELGEKGNRLVIIILHDPDGKELVRYTKVVTIPQAIPGQPPEINIILAMRDIIFIQPGPHQFILLVDKDFKSQLPIQIIQITNASQSPKTP